MLGTSNEIRNPGLRTLPPGVERYFVKGGGLSVIEVFPEDKIEIINDEGKQICEIIVFPRSDIQLYYRTVFHIVSFSLIFNQIWNKSILSNYFASNFEIQNLLLLSTHGI